MIKRRYYKQDHGDKSATSSSSSGSDSNSNSDPNSAEADSGEDVGEQEISEGESGDDQEGLQKQQESSGYQSEDSSGNEVDGPSVDDEEQESPRDGTDLKDLLGKALIRKAGNADSANGATNLDDTVEVDLANCILKCKSVFKCKLCPRIICLNEEMVRVHLKSKRHARSKKLLGEGRLKLMLNSDGELEEEQETHAERHARTMSLAQQLQKPKKDSGRQRQSWRRKKRSRNPPEKKRQIESSSKKRRKV